MNAQSEKPPRKRKLWEPLLATTAGLALLYFLLPAIVPTLWAVSMKVRGNAAHCPWLRILTFFPDLETFTERIADYEARLSMERYDSSWGIDLISDGSRRFWIRRDGDKRDGRKLLAYLLAEHEWIASQNPAKAVKRGDIVIDCGAHVGVFTRNALGHGAEKVIAVDPDPTQVECLRRNFAEEIAAGKVVVVPKGVWSSEGSLTLHIGSGNSGMSSLVIDRGGASVEVPLVTIDQLVEELRLPRVDYIKFDIEGAEREALKGGLETIRNDRPRLMVESYHREDDMTVLPQIIAQAYKDYQMTCGACELSAEFEGQIVPHYTFYD